MRGHGLTMAMDQLSTHAGEHLGQQLYGCFFREPPATHRAQFFFHYDRDILSTAFIDKMSLLIGHYHRTEATRLLRHRKAEYMLLDSVDNTAGSSGYMDHFHYSSLL
jgi:hypothetical protein